MIKVYGTPMCRDCVRCKYNFDAYGIEYEFTDICGTMQDLKDFVTLRDESCAFDEMRGSGHVGLPCLVLEDGTVTLDWEKIVTDAGHFVKDPESAPAACSLDGKGC